ncbi:class I SAM-dependent methyltransferase [Williamsia sp. 1135]|uniref:O-methyltransferase n=1 Tax=Williamsia sp. 1135 TaxID=1889262 RepID=UPI000A0F54E9|nr:class I SAM-dependent methyltransferase [Williamsia sp. 1135]ORM30608.1 SAM-dependent methyltransferase [Williamsia sp. 1135]
MAEMVSIPSHPVTPSTILAVELAELVELVDAAPEPAPGLKDRLRRARDLARGLDPYLEECTTPESPALAALAARTRAERWGERSLVSGSGPLEQEMLSGHVEGQTLKFLVHMTRARRVLDIGMFTGYSALAMAEALPEGGEVVACEVDPYVADVARQCFAESPAGSRIRVEVGPALNTVLRLDGPFDLVFIDADKTGYLDYFHYLIGSELLAPHGVIAVDNTLLQGEPYANNGSRSTNGQAIADFNRVVANDARVEQVLLPLRDGVTLIRRTGADGP